MLILSLWKVQRKQGYETVKTCASYKLWLCSCAVVTHTKPKAPLSAVLGIQLQADAHCKSFSDIVVFLLILLDFFYSLFLAATLSKASKIATLSEPKQGEAPASSWFCCAWSELGIFCPGQFKQHLLTVPECSRTVRWSNKWNDIFCIHCWMNLKSGPARECILPAQYQGLKYHSLFPG